MRGMSKRVVSAATILTNYLYCQATSNTFINNKNKFLQAFQSSNNSIRPLSTIQRGPNIIRQHSRRTNIQSLKRNHQSILKLSSSANNSNNNQTMSRKVLKFDSLPSTQDETRKQLMDESNFIDEGKKYLALTTKMQTKGRGTSGRTWIGKEGNTFVTVTIPTDDLKIPITLLPLQVGVIMVKRIHDIIKQNLRNNRDGGSLPSIKVKWPNDVLVDGKKIAGVLIESDKDCKGNNYFLVGVGINYKYAPEVKQDGPERGRVATCIYDHIQDDSESTDVATQLGEDIAHDIWDWVRLQMNWDGAGAAVIQNFEYWTDFGQELILRDVPGNQTVRPIQVESDGRLKVQDKSGKERLLCVDYLL